MSKTTEILKACSKLKTDKAKELRIKAFLTHTQKIIEAFILFEKVDYLLISTLNDLQLSTYTVASFLKKIQSITPQPGDPYIYRNYL